MNIIEIIAQDLFDKVRSRFTNLQMGTEEGAVTSDPKEARFFDFDFVLEGNNLGRVSLSINERGSLKIFYSQGITEGTDSITRGLWYDFLKEMRYFAKRRMMRFDTRDITKGNLNKNDFQYLAQNGSKETDMNESSMYGSSKTSYRKLENTRLVIRHGKAVDEAKAGDRSRHINALFIENADGERFKYPYNHLAGAKAMQRHVANGGRPYDDGGTAIIQMSEQISQLATFKRHAKTGQLNDDANMIHARVGAKLEQLRHNLNSIQGQKSYESWMESFVPSSIDTDLDPVTMEDYKNKFTVKQFDETLASVFPLIHSIMKEAGTVDLEDLVHEGEEETCDECGMLESKCECDDVDEAYNPNSAGAEHARELKAHHRKDLETKAKSGDDSAKKRLQSLNDKEERMRNDYNARMERESVGFENFENWADAISEGTMTPDQVAQFKDLISSGLTLGPDGTSAIEALAGIGIEDPALEQALKGLAAVDPAADPLETIEAWLKVNDPEVLSQLGGGEEEQPAPEAPPAEEPAPAPEAPPAPEAGGVEQPVAEEEQMDNKEQHLEDPKPNLKELAEFIGAFYNPHAREQGLGEWRKGATELGIMAGKQFGDRAGKVVELMVTRMQQRSQSNHEFSEVMKLAGIAVPEATDTVEKDKDGKVKSWKHEGDWEKSKNKEPRGKVTNLSDKARRETEKKSSEGFDPLKHVKNPTPGEKKAAKDVKRGSYADRAAMLKSAEADGRLKKDESFDVMLRLAGLAK
jgi:hypothetical protein